MRRAGWQFGLLALVVLTIGGCGGGSGGDGSQASSNASSDNIPPPDRAVFDFLEAVRTGDDAKAAEMLTDLARTETAKYELVVAPPGSDTASFKVGDVEHVAEGVAHVASMWTDVGEDGQPRSDEIVWVLRREPEGWRIGGMATKLFEGEFPLLLNFEDPEDMMRKQRLAEEEIQRRAKAPPQQAEKQPSTDPAAKTRRQ